MLKPSLQNNNLLKWLRSVWWKTWQKWCENCWELAIKTKNSSLHVSNRIGSFDEEKWKSVIHSTIASLEWEIIDAFESSLLYNTRWKYWATSIVVVLWWREQKSHWILEQVIAYNQMTVVIMMSLNLIEGNYVVGLKFISPLGKKIVAFETDNRFLCIFIPAYLCLRNFDIWYTNTSPSTIDNQSTM